MSLLKNILNKIKTKPQEKTISQLDIYLKRISDRWKGKGLREVVVEDHGYGHYSVKMRDKDENKN